MCGSLSELPCANALFFRVARTGFSRIPRLLALVDQLCYDIGGVGRWLWHRHRSCPPARTIVEHLHAPGIALRTWAGVFHAAYEAVAFLQIRLSSFAVNLWWQLSQIHAGAERRAVPAA